LFNEAVFISTYSEIVISSYSSAIIIPFVNMRITAGDKTWKAIVNYFVHKFF